MPTWFIVVIIIALVLPGAAIILGGVAAMFFAPAAYDRRKKWEAEGRCLNCGSAETIAGSPLCPACGQPRPAELPRKTDV
jgi:hypothetical protein